MRNKMIVATLFAGALATVTFAHSNMMTSNQGMQNAMGSQQNMMGGTNNQGIQSQQNMMSTMHNMMHGMINTNPKLAGILSFMKTVILPFHLQQPLRKGMQRFNAQKTST